VVLEDPYVRVFDVRIPAGDTTLYHSHVRDSIYIDFSGTTNLVNQQLGSDPKALRLNPGDVAFGDHSKVAFTHRVSNLSEEEFHVMDIEVVAAPMASTSTIRPLSEGQQSVLDNTRVRVTRIVLEPGESFVDASTVASRKLIVSLSMGRIAVASDSAAEQRTAVRPGYIYRSTESMVRRIRNEGDERVELVNIEIK
jgi:hypothetical protein